MDRWVKGIENGIDKEPPVTVYWELGGAGRPGPSWTTTYSEWPARQTERRTYYLAGNGSLSPTTSDDSAAIKPRTYAYPAGTQLIGNNAQFAIAPDALGSLTWTSAPLTEDMMILGSARATFYVSSDNLDTDLVLDLLDVYPNGDVQYVQRDLLRASLRRVDTIRSTADELWRTYDRKEPLVPGQVYEIKMALPAVGAVIRAGHRLQLVLAAPSAIAQPEWGVVPIALPGRNTVHASSRHRSRIELPVVPGGKADGPEPACGSLQYQPCRPAAAGGRGARNN
jgi:putative CocE/NonD family hydrolase